jgi:hypothetical protein
MAERLATLPAKPVAWVRFQVLARPTFIVDKWLFSVTLQKARTDRSRTAAAVVGKSLSQPTVAHTTE